MWSVYSVYSVIQSFRSYQLATFSGWNLRRRQKQIRQCCLNEFMVKPPVPRLRLRVKTPVKTTAKARSGRAPRPRDRKDANLNPLPDLNVSKVILPQVPPCDVILEYKKYHLTKTFLDLWIWLQQPSNPEC